MNRMRRGKTTGSGLSRTGDPEATPHSDMPVRNTVVRPAGDRQEVQSAHASVNQLAHARASGRAETGSPDAYLHRRASSETPQTDQPDPAATVTPEMRVLRAGLEDCLCHLVELYGADVLDTFLQRRLRRNIAPILAHAEEMDTESQRSRVRTHARAAEQILRDVVESVRLDPSLPELN